MKKKILALCDREERYASQMTEYLQNRGELPFEVHTYTEPEKLAAFGRREQIEILVVAESAYTYEVSNVTAAQTILLNESGKILQEGICSIDKYQNADRIYKQIMACCLERKEPEEESPMPVSQAAAVQMIGFYSPVKRCLQTSMALTLGQTLCRWGRTLYISFEQYAGWNGMLAQEGSADLSDLLCFQEENGERFRYRLRLTERNIGGLYYIPPVYAGQNLLYITPAQWQKLLKRIAEEGGYDFILLDLSEGIQGVYELLRMCGHIYTIIKEDHMAAGKVAQYEQLLRMQDYDDILDKTKKYELPFFRTLPSRMEQYTRGELADYVRKIMKEDLGVGDG